MKKYKVTSGCGIYGSRVWLHKDYVKEMLDGTPCFIDQLPHNPKHPVAVLLREVCSCGGADKFNGEWLGYELSAIPAQGERDLFRVRETLNKFGFEEIIPFSGTEQFEVI